MRATPAGVSIWVSTLKFEALMKQRTPVGPLNGFA
jgi:hypothetical protein